MIQTKLDDLKALISELERSKEYESKKYHLFSDKTLKQCKGNPLRYYLYRISDKKQLCYGTMEKLNSYMNLRNIKDVDILTDC